MSILTFAHLINEYSTGLVLAFYAVQRLILVVFPFKSKLLLTKRFYCTSFVCVVIIDCMLLLAHGIAVYFGREPCTSITVYQSFWPNPLYRLWGNLIIFFCVPASICAICYTLISFQFMKRLFLRLNPRLNQNKGHWKKLFILVFE